MGDDLEDGQYEGLIDNDPALDCLLYQGMRRNRNDRLPRITTRDALGLWH
jgi:hypothetical protein